MARSTEVRAGAVRRRLRCRGAVQGVGFRPAVWRLATSLDLTGCVLNDADGAAIEVEGSPEHVTAFEERLADALPPLARLAGCEASDLAPLGSESFRVEDSDRRERRTALIPPDAALCRACRAELEDPDDRRHHYPFTTCTDCGPRYTLAHSLPYDRERTSMARFPLCSDCAAEYADPATRRFHAEPLCCPACGPRLTLLDPSGEPLADAGEALLATRFALARGEIVALQGLGGFQLACRADRESVVARLRARKHRPTKPLAVMVRDLGVAARLVRLAPEDEALLSGPRGPILLTPRRARAGLAPGVAPGIDDLGVLLPTTPLHVELFRRVPYDALVMTSGNRSDEPICRTPEEAIEQLVDIADLLLVHEREIVRRTDDSVVRTAGDGHVLVRRSRGWVPEPLPLPVAAPEPVLALGGHLQTTACLAVGTEAFPSQHVGDLDNDAARAFLVEVGCGLEDFLEVRSRALAVDEHPDYASTWAGERLARERGGRVLRVQHHLAHAAAVLAEHGRFPVAGERAGALVLDGTGYGPDGTAWGGECLLLDGAGTWDRVAHTEALPLVGGERAVREPWRVAVAALAGAEEDPIALARRTPLARLVDAERMRQVAELASRGGWPLAHGAGRLFEAAGALAGRCSENCWEGEAAARLEACAARAPEPVSAWDELASADPRRPLPSTALLAALARRLADGEEPERAAAGFHATFARLAADLVQAALPEDARVVALAGGCLVNRLMRAALAAELEHRGLEPLLPRALPPGDGGLAYGQAVLGSYALAHGAPLRYLGGP